MIEVELKFPLADRNTLLTALDRVHPGLSFQQRQETDEYFQHPCRDFKVTDEALRIRLSGGVVELTWKGPKLDPRTKSRKELELTVNEMAETSDQRHNRLREILLALGFSSAGLVHKTRHTAKFLFHQRLVQVSIDTVEDLGLFAELEIICDPSEQAGATELLLQLAEQLELKHTERRSYIALLAE
ncbi:MAG: class IV adenylate cyclase, partial [Planctomycetaceae bacterium]